MELSKTTKEVIMQAQTLQMEAEGGTLCQEHLFYGLLLMASYLDEPMNDSEYRAEAKALRKYLSGKMRSISAARDQVRRDALDGGDDFVDARPSLGRAVEIAGDQAITPLDLAKAIQENPSPTIRALNGLSSPAGRAEDEKYNPKPVTPPKPPVHKDPPVVISGTSSGHGSSSSGSGNAGGNNAGINVGSLVHMLQQLDKLNDVKPVKRKRKTKMGLFTYRGGTAVAALQYFLFGLLIPGAILFALQYFFKLVTEPATPWLQFARNMFVLLWGFYLLRGVVILIGTKTKAFSMFCRSLVDLALIAGIMYSVKTCFYPELTGFFDYPRWVKYVGGVFGVLVMIVSTVLYEALNYTDAQKKRSISMGGLKGPTPKVIFQSITRTLILPLAAAVGLWAYQKPIEGWQEKAFWILGFLFAWNIPNIILTGLALHTGSRWYWGRGEGLFKFLRSFYTFLFIPLLVLFLHWLFGWFPMKLWVMIVLGVYTLLMFIGSIIYARD